jgi:hypothetical protein
VSATPLRAVAGVLALAALFLTACGTTVGPSARPPAAIRLVDCGSPPQASPTVLAVICSTNSITARDLRWSAWGKPVTTAIGTAVVDLCAYSDCHTGKYRAVPIVLVGSRIVNCPRQARVYSRLQYIFVGPTPFPGVPAHMKFPKFWWGSARPSAGNQTVSMPC